MSTQRIFAFECHPRGVELWATVVNATTRSKARYLYWLRVREPWPHVPLTSIVVRKIGGPRDTPAIESARRCRGRIDLCGGTRVLAGGSPGTVVDGDSGNFEVLLDTGQRGIWHPGDLILESEDQP